MSEFSSQWLALREPADHRSRNQALRQQLNQVLQNTRSNSSEPLRIIDLGSGTGSNLRGLAPHLDGDQHWTLIDYDPKLIEAARAALGQWADKSETGSDAAMHLHKNGKHIHVDFLCTDLSKNIELILEQPADLLTAAAFCMTTSKSTSRFFSDISFESRISAHTGAKGSSRITAATNRGPAHGPRPASSTPANGVIPAA